MKTSNDRWLTEWKLSELREQGWFVSDWLTKSFPHDWCERIDRQFPKPGCPQRWEAFKLLLGTNGLICRREDVTSELWEEAKRKWDQNENRGHIGMMHAAQSAEHAEGGFTAGINVWKDNVVKDGLKRLRV